MQDGQEADAESGFHGHGACGSDGKAISRTQSMCTSGQAAGSGGEGVLASSPEQWCQLLRALCLHGSKGSAFEQLHRTVAIVSARMETGGLMHPDMMPRMPAPCPPSPDTPSLCHWMHTQVSYHTGLMIRWVAGHIRTTVRAEK